MAIALLEDEYGGAIERTTLINKLIDTHGLNKSTAYMQVMRLIRRGELQLDGNVVRLAHKLVTQ